MLVVSDETDAPPAATEGAAPWWSEWFVTSELLLPQSGKSATGDWPFATCHQPDVAEAAE